MRILLGLLALALLGADAPTPPGHHGISYELCLIEMNGVDWRAPVYTQLEPVCRQGSATVWTVPAGVARSIRSGAGRVLSAPRLAANSGVTAHVSQRRSQDFVTHIVRVADGPVNHASTVALVPQIESAREGLAATVQGRKLDQGVLTQIVLEDTRVTSLHRVALTEIQEPDHGKPAGKRWETLAAEIKVPEIAKCEVSGEWLIPNDGVLVVSLGAYTTADDKGKAVVRERLALIEARVGVAAAATGMHTGLAVPAHFESVLGVNAEFAPRRSAGVPMPAPMVPSRSMPQPTDADGLPVPLPPLPEDVAPPTSMPESSEPCATPQTRKKGDPLPVGPSRVPATDRAAKQAGFDDEACLKDDVIKILGAADLSAIDPDAGCLSPCCTAAKTAAAGPVPTARRFSFRIPAFGNVDVRVSANPTPPVDVALKPAEHAPRPNSASPPPPDLPEAP